MNANPRQAQMPGSRCSGVQPLLLPLLSSVLETAEFMATVDSIQKRLLDKASWCSSALAVSPDMYLYLRPFLSEEMHCGLRVLSLLSVVRPDPQGLYYGRLARRCGFLRPGV